MARTIRDQRIFSRPRRDSSRGFSRVPILSRAEQRKGRKKIHVSDQSHRVTFAMAIIPARLGCSRPTPKPVQADRSQRESIIHGTRTLHRRAPGPVAGCRWAWTGTGPPPAASDLRYSHRHQTKCFAGLWVLDYGSRRVLDGARAFLSPSALGAFTENPGVRLSTVSSQNSSQREG